MRLRDTLKFPALLLAVALAACASNPPYPQTAHTTSQALPQARAQTGGPARSAFLAARMLTAEGVALLKLNEGQLLCAQPTEAQRHCPYDDSSQYCTIGYGHLIGLASCSALAGELARLGYAGGITEAAAEALLLADLLIAQEGVEAHIDRQGVVGRARLSDYQYDALVSFVFNIGGDAFAGSTLLRRLQDREDISGNSEIAYQFTRWRKSNGVVVQGLINRREREIAHFFKGYEVPTVAKSLEPGAPDDAIDINVGERGR